MRRGRITRRHLGLAALTAITLVVAACIEPPTTGSGNAVETGGQGGGELPDCPLDTLDGAPGPVEINLWYGGLQGSAKATMDDTAARYNASQDQVRLTANDQGSSYEEVFRKYESASSSSPDQLPDLIYLEDTQLQVMIDGGQVLPAQSCIEAAGYELTDIEPAARSKYTVGDVLYPGYMNVSTPVLYYNKAHWVKAGLDPDDPPATLDELYTQARALKDAGVSEKPLSFKADRWFFEVWLTGIGEDIVNNGNGREVDEALAIENALDAVLFDNGDVADSLAKAQDEVT
ncbi:MAG: extracellular solute-binding protein, partial [Candidatus Limnocylindria bacterium]